MKFQIRKRKLNKNEIYACEQSDVKELFSHLNMSISFGWLGRTHSFSKLEYHHPHINGIIIAEAYVSRDEFQLPYFLLCFYVIKDKQYNSDMRKVFVESCLPQILEWCNKMLERPDILKVKNEYLFIELLHGTFRVHQYRP